jgi:hypothetical protein
MSTSKQDKPRWSVGGKRQPKQESAQDIVLEPIEPYYPQRCRNRLIAAGVALVIVAVVVAVVVGVVVSKGGDDKKGGDDGDRGPAGSPRSANSPTPSPTSSDSTPSDACVLSSSGLSTAFDDLGTELASELEGCETTECGIEVNSTQAYSSVYSACQEAQGALQVYTLVVSCDNNNTVGFYNYPLCLMSERTDSACDPEFYVDDLEFAFDFDNCAETAMHTGTMDFSP